LTTLVDLRTDLSDAREILELGGLSEVEKQATERRIRELEAELGDDAPAPSTAEDELPDDRQELWALLGALNDDCENEALTPDLRRSQAKDRDRVWRKLERTGR
jgi:hypothetical protein